MSAATTHEPIVGPSDDTVITDPVDYGGPHKNGSDFSLPEDKFEKYEKSERKYKDIVVKVLARADVVIGGDRPFDIVVHNPKLYHRVIRDGSMGLGEAFMEGWWDTKDFYALDVFFERVLKSDLEYYLPNNATDWYNVFKAKMFNPQTKKLSKKVGMQHYDIGNAFFEAMLGKYMQYSCAYWECYEPAVAGSTASDGAINGHVIQQNGGSTRSGDHSQCSVSVSESGSLGRAGLQKRRILSLDEAQFTKLRMIGDKLNLREGMEVLDVGCGWGGLAHFLSETYKVKVTGITISEEQRKCAAARVKDCPNVTILKQDYRDMNFDKKFDRIVSVGMFEHVGPQNYDTYFKHMRRLLNDKDPEAVFLLHTIGSKITKESADQWYLKYIFPGGCLPSVANIGKNIEKYFVMEDWHNFGSFYGKTLLAWRKNFLRAWNASQEKRKEGSEIFFRMFYYYLSSSAGAFKARDLQLWQVILSPSGVDGYVDAVRP